MTCESCGGGLSSDTLYEFEAERVHMLKRIAAAEALTRGDPKWRSTEAARRWLIKVAGGDTRYEAWDEVWERMDEEERNT